MGENVGHGTVPCPMSGDVGAIEMMVFQIKWNLHLVDGKCPKNFGCENMAWPSE